MADAHAQLHAAHGSPDDQYLETPPGSGYEHTDATVSAMVKFGFWLALSAILVHFVLAGMFTLLVRTSTEPVETRAYPLAAEAAPQLPPAPRLQKFPDEDMGAVRTQQERELNSYGWVDKEAGIVHIPIEEGMRLMMERGLPTRDQAPAGAGPTGMMPSDSSSGRVLEIRRQ